jgi:hypothetical protein
MTTSDLLKRFALGAALAFPALVQAAPTSYEFERLIPRGQLAHPPGLNMVALAADGSAAFGATRSGGHREGLFRTGTAPAQIARERDFSRFGDVAINARGQVAFEGSPEDAVGEGIFRGNGRKIVLIAGTRDVGDFDFVRASPSINAHGVVAFSGERIVGGDFIDGVYVGTGGPVRPAYDTTRAFRDFSGNPAINDQDTVAFLATRTNGVGGLFMGTGGKDFVTVADDTGPLTGVLGFSDPSLNERGEVAFRAGTNEDFDDNGSSTGGGVFLYTGGQLSTVLEGPFSEFFSFGDPSLNNLGQVAFVVEPTFGQQILVTGPDLVEDRVIGTGDALGTHTVSGIVFTRDGYNDAGQLAFVAYFTDGSSNIILATPRAQD